MSWQDRDPARSVPFAPPAVSRAVKGLLIANVALFVLQYVFLEGFFPAADAAMTRWFALFPAGWRLPWLPLWQLLSYGFLHGSPMHLLGNMLFLYFLGTMLEAEIGPRRFLGFYALAIVLAGACQLALGLALGQEGPIVGASGGVLAIVCGLAAMRPNLRLIFIIVPLTLKTVAWIYVGLDLFNVVMELKGHGSGVASFAHLSGALFGYLAVRRGWIWRDPLEEVEGWRTRRSEERRQSDEERLDQLLIKIEREGLGSLSTSERAFLRRASKRR